MVDLTKSEKACILLQCIDKLSVKKRLSVLSLFDDFGDIFDLYAEYRDIIVQKTSESFYDALKEGIEKDVVGRELIECDKLGITPVTYVSENYPDRLFNISAPPLVLFCRGRLELLSCDLSIGVVGSRKVSRYGVDTAEKFGRELADNGVVVVSGLARGIDTASHKGALSVEGDTIAVVATGLDTVYPPENLSVFNEICEKGLVVTEYVTKTQAQPFRFPERNRIITGLSDGLLVVEAGKKSGALITLDCAIEEGRECFIVPANINSATSAGSNERLRAMPHAITFDVSDILNRFNRTKKEVLDVSAIQLDFEEAKIVELLEAGEKHFDEILDMVDLDSPSLSALLTRMEISGIIKDLGSNYYGL
ncbi:MAG: DNA-processing protein DprA [Clostridia bacterium]|nr:DNA-processing protein DprA [Clostridia bacterium]